jgi:serine/threonine-protein phosphatase 2B catalytic subunit
MLEMESNLIKLQNPLTIVGDIHGQFYDLVGILDRLHLGKEKILFLGDYVDRGCFSIEVLVILLCMKINWPTRVFLLRGNHECEQMTNHFNFRQ